MINMNDSKLNSIEQIREFLEGTAEVTFTTPANEPQRRTFVTRILKRFKYFTLVKGHRGVLFTYMQRLTGYSRQHLSRLITQYRESKSITPKTRASRTSFSHKYTREDMRLLAEVDSLHDTLSGPATKVLLERACKVFGDVRFVRLAQISVSHLYNLRKADPYLINRFEHKGTKRSPVTIGTRKAPAPQGLPGYIRIDTVHQGDWDGAKGIYHINAVDIVTQWELVASVERISEAYLLPVIAMMLEGFPFEIRGFHSDSGSEYVNHEIAGLLDKLRIEFTRSRPRHTNDNALVESKNGAVIRKCMGYSHIPQKHAAAINQFYASTLNPYLNFHRPCFFAVDKMDAKGKIRKTYPQDQIMTPWQRLKATPDYQGLLKKNINPEMLEYQASNLSDNEAARQVQNERKRLFQMINRRSKSAA